MPRVPQQGRNWLQAWKDASYIAREAARERSEREAPTAAPEAVGEPDLSAVPTRREPPSGRALRVMAALGIEPAAQEAIDESNAAPAAR